jgi:hypothetical protein
VEVSTNLCKYKALARLAEVKTCSIHVGFLSFYLLFNSLYIQCMKYEVSDFLDPQKF